MYGDTETIRGLARTMREQGNCVRVEAARVLALAQATPWEGLAADAMRLRVRSQAAALDRTASLADEAAAALEQHAAEVDRLKALIAAIERKALALVAAARERLARLVGAVGGVVGGIVDAVAPDPVDQLLARFVPPPSGHRDWLTVDLPGLS